MQRPTEIKISTEYITLGQLLKFAGIVDRGSDSKIFLLENEVIIDGVQDNRRGRKLRGGETLEIGGNTYKVVR
ncbi:MAG: RNA-binding S4 domain-containing protein [Bacilli bacterium]|nr:RNA-binding S4 domain-containing protein [Bacilli bacterium]